ncbi:MAG: DUF4417 domain-containing protein [Synergistaceae bacterium]|nr:DUF4417 domain-containing protein [Synergistaceae bacterium]
MNIEIKKLAALKPAPYNPRNINKKDFNDLKNSIKEFGYVEPIIYNKATGYVVGGHQRLKALQDLELEEVECVVIDVPAEKEKALNIALNKISGEWDKDKLFNLLDELNDIDFDIELTGFNLNDLDDYKLKLEDSTYDSELESDYNGYRLREFYADRAVGFYQMPLLKACHYMPEGLIPFDNISGSEEYNKGVHFFLYDYKFERVWRDPYKYIDRLKQFTCMTTLDFSLYADMPIAMHVWNVYRSRLIGQIMQDAGINVIPIVRWGVKGVLDFYLDGIEQGGIIAVSTVGIQREKEIKELFCAGISEVIERLKPEAILHYGKPITEDFGGVPVKYFSGNYYLKLGE